MSGATKGLFLSRDAGLLSHWKRALKGNKGVVYDSLSMLVPDAISEPSLLWVDLAAPLLPAWEHADWAPLLQHANLRVVATARNPQEFKITGEPLRTENQSLMFRKDDPAFKALVDRVVTGMMKSGEMDKLYQKWFMSPIPPRGVNIHYPLNAETREAFTNPSDKGI